MTPKEDTYPTPRCNAEVMEGNMDGRDVIVVPASLARDLERELAAATSRLSETTTDRDEWKRQHENLVGVREADVRRLGDQLDASRRYIAILDGKAKAEGRLAGFYAMIEENKRLRREQDEHHAYAEQHRAALEFYADTGNYRQGGPVGVASYTPIYHDGGDRARAALAKNPSDSAPQGTTRVATAVMSGGGANEGSIPSGSAQTRNEIGVDSGNTGHGHVYQRPDGVRARCGGPMVCKVCALDAARKARGQSGVFRWIPVEERLPRDGEYVLVWDAPMKDVGRGFNDDEGWHWSPHLDMTTPPTHWMPMEFPQSTPSQGTSQGENA